MMIQINTLYRIIVFIPLTIAILFELKTFKIWEQILFLWGKRASPIDQILDLTPHSFRYFLMYPIVSIPEALQIEKNFFFSLITLSLGFFTVGLIVDSAQIISRRKGSANTASLFISFFVVLLLFFMNGRGVFALFGFALLVNTFLALPNSKLPTIWVFAKVFLALLFCSVSSGTLVVSFLAVILYLFSQIGQIRGNIFQLRFSRKGFQIFLVGIIICMVFSGIVLVGLNKNLDYYGSGYDGFIKMFGHGVGIYLIPFLESISFQHLGSPSSSQLF